MRLVAAVGFLLTFALLACVRLYAEPPKRVEAVGHFGTKTIPAPTASR